MSLAKNKLLGHFKKVVSNMDSRPLLQCINYNKNGSIYATDSHTVIKVSDFHQLENDLNINLYTMEVVDGYFPEMERFINMPNVTTEINIDINMFTKAIKAFPSGFVVTLVIKDKTLTMKSQGFDGFKIEVPLHDCEGEIEISCQPHYLINGLQFMKDAKNSIEKQNDGLALIQFCSPIRSFKMNLDDKYEYLITPVRTF